MNNILNSIKLDYYIIKSSNLGRLSIIALVPLLAGLIGKNPPLMLGLAMMLAGFFMSTVFAAAEKSNLNKLYGILPVKKQQTVIGRYLFALIAGIGIAAVASIFVFAIGSILKIHLGSFEFAAWLCGSFLVFCFVVAAQFPLYFKYDFSKLAAFANLPYIIVLLGGSYLIKRDPQLFGQTIKFFTQSPSMVWVVGLGGSLLILAVSMFIAIGLYQKREL